MYMGCAVHTGYVFPLCQKRSSVLTDSQQEDESKSCKFHDDGLEWKKGVVIIQ